MDDEKKEEVFLANDLCPKIRNDFPGRSSCYFCLMMKNKAIIRSIAISTSSKVCVTFGEMGNCTFFWLTFPPEDKVHSVPCFAEIAKKYQGTVFEKYFGAHCASSKGGIMMM